MDDKEFERDRAHHLNRLVESESPRKVVVAGPGTGKTHSFEVLLNQVTGDRLILTFINNLVEELKRRLGDLGRVETLHGLARWLLHGSPSPGLTTRFEYHPFMDLIHADDVSVVLGRKTSADDVAAVFHRLDEENELLSWALRSGDYYDAVGYTDSVYRLVKHLRDHPEVMPRFDQVIVDEFQDFNPLEVELIQHLHSRSRTLIVGDDDQSLYSFKSASPDHLRQVAESDEFERFSLPYSSRCTEVLVTSVGLVVQAAQKEGLLGGRLDRPYMCYMPDKRQDSETYPRIIHAECTVHTSKAPLMARYVEQWMRTIPPEHVAESWDKGHSTGLLIGPNWLAMPIFEYLNGALPNVELKTSSPVSVELIDGYELLAKDERSRLGWRVILFVERPDFGPAVINEALMTQAELSDLLPEEFRRRHLEVVVLLQRARRGQLNESEMTKLASSVFMSQAEIRVHLGLEEAPPTPEPDRDQPSLVVTSQVGAKGMEAAHVFVVGLNENVFPASDPPTDDDVCQLIVALTRGTKSCHLLSARHWLASTRNPRLSRFVDWLEPVIETVQVKAESFK